MCGYIFNKNNITPIINDLNYVNQLHEERMIKYLQNEIQEGKIWRIHTVKDKQLIEELSQHVFMTLIEDTITFYF